MPLCFGASGSVRASSIMRSARCAPDVQIFWPLMMKSSPSCTALVCSDARSEPEPGSLKPWHQNVSPERMPGRCSRFCSSLPCTMIVGPARPMPRKFGRGARRARHLFVEDELLHDGEAGAAVLLGPGRRDPAALRERAQPSRSRSSSPMPTPSMASSAARRSRAARRAGSLGPPGGTRRLRGCLESPFFPRARRSTVTRRFISIAAIVSATQAHAWR